MMKVIFITQDEPFYLGQHFDYLFSRLPSWVYVSGVILLDPSPFKPESFWKKVKKTYKVFGLIFSFRYSLRYIKSRFFQKKFLMRNVLRKHGLNEVKLPKKSVNARESLKCLAGLKPDLILSIQANQIFKPALLALPRYGCLNLHTSLLPQYKGLMPSFWALKNNEKEIGVSVFFMDKGVDTGEILVQDTLPIDPSDSLESLINKTKRAGMDAIIKALFSIKSNDYQTLKFSPDEGSYYSFPSCQDVKEFRHAGKRFW